MEHAIVGGKEVLDWLMDTQCRDQVRQHLRAVDAAPHHGVVRNLIKLVPRKLCRHKIVNSALFHNLRQCARVAKHVRQPQNAVIHAKLLLEKTLAVHELAHKRLAGGQVTVRLDPHTALWLPAPFLDALLCLFIQLWIALF